MCGLSGFLDRHTQAKKGPQWARQASAKITRLIWELRAREYECCGQKIVYFLEPGFQRGVCPAARDYCERHRIARPYKKNEQARVKAIIVPYARKAWTGGRIELGTSHGWSPRWKPFLPDIITTARTWILAHTSTASDITNTGG